MQTQPAETKSHLGAAISRVQGGSSDFDLNPEMAPKGVTLRDASVLVLVDLSSAQPEFILTKRASQMRNHGGQIAFAGGKRDEDDASGIETALREAQEEIALDPAAVEVIGSLPSHQTVTGFNVTPVVGVLSKPFDPVIDPGEVAEVFRVPYDFLMNSESYQIQSRRWRGTRRMFYTVPFGPYYIWGATARILRALADGFSE